jgi:hypothetical protein
METKLKNSPTISIGQRIALPNFPKGIIVGIDHGRVGEDASIRTWWRVKPDGSGEVIRTETMMAVPILGTIGEREKP